MTSAGSAGPASMPKLPRGLSCSQVERALSRLGFVFVHQRKHRLWERGGIRVVVPAHRVIKTGTLRAILREAA